MIRILILLKIFELKKVSLLRILTRDWYFEEKIREIKWFELWAYSKSHAYAVTCFDIFQELFELTQDPSRKLIVFVGGENLPFHLSGDEKLDSYDSWWYQNRLVQIGQLVRKETTETISMNRTHLTYSSYEWIMLLHFMVSKVYILSSWPIWTSQFWYNQLS